MNKAYAIKALQRGMDQLDSGYGGEDNMPDFASEAYQEMNHAINMIIGDTQ